MEEASKKERWEERYESGDLPWDTGRHDRNLEELLKEQAICPCQVLELGCGTGTNALWLATQGFDVTAVDISSRAISAARQKTAVSHLDVKFLEIDVHETSLPGGPYDLVFDRGCFHSSGTDEDRELFVARAYAAPLRESGPPQLTAHQITRYVESHFEILLLKATHFDSEQDAPPPAWACLMRKRC
jgi:SAM-dependent methyltransferase